MERADEFFKVAKEGELPEGEGKIVHAGVKKLALFNVDGELHCIQNYCPHAGGFLGLGSFKGTTVRCPRHNWGFDVVTGECKTNARYCVKRYQTKIEDGWIWVGLPDSSDF